VRRTVILCGHFIWQLSVVTLCHISRVHAATSPFMSWCGCERWEM